MRSLALIAALLATAPAFAQQQIQLPPASGAAPSGPPPLQMQPQQHANAEAFPPPPSSAPVAMPQVAPAQTVGFPPAGPVAQPQQPPVFQPPAPGVTPAPGAADAGPPSAMQQKVDALRTQVEQKYGQLDNAQPFLTGNQLQQMQQRQLRIRDTLMLGQEAKALVELNKQLDEINGEGGKGGATSQHNEEETKRRIEEAVAQAIAAKKLEEENAPKPVIASIHGSGGSLRAIVLVPYSGQFTVRSGSGLPGGMKVASVSDNGVDVIDKEGKRYPLAFGVAVPSTRPASAVGAVSGARTVSMPIGNSPLPMGGGFGGR